ncbi:hypothetical protein P7D22_11485 [Lichenihabitans sp. Uapishka_5]|uniref:hypothetical protein n=1 Tax=Lichenihabitans sp. Uapishka_5 TaxID=3037302 RepID=UPI0029E7E986|nr:hypothetical protein [Lichenihabitans sp. Uapishka_5]MDX7951791.1 hypothetical protein [Lichenihabitans sp. Uapishka_5]
MKSKNPVRDYRKAVVAVLSKYFAVDAATVRFSAKAIRAHRAAGENPAYVALSIGRTRNLPIAPAFRRQKTGRR